jgi:ferredoxin
VRDAMPKVTIQPIGITLDAERGQTTCAGVIERGMQNLSPMGRYENLNLVRQRGRNSLKAPIRLCCQARVQGDVEVRKPGVKPW